MYKIVIEILAKSLFKLPILKCRRENAFVTGRKYSLSARIKNIGTNNFLGGDFSVHIVWSNGLLVFWSFNVDPLKSKSDVKCVYGDTDVLSDGPGLFLAKATDINGRAVVFHNIEGKALSPQPIGLHAEWTHIYTIIPKRAEELYQLWALEIAVVSLFVLITLQIIDWFIRPTFKPMLTSEWVPRVLYKWLVNGLTASL